MPAFCTWVQFAMKHENMAAWTPGEDQMILNSFAIEGRRWSKIAAQLEGRTSASVRNRFLRIEKGMKLRQAGLSKNRCAACGQQKLGHVCNVKLSAVHDADDEQPLALMPPNGNTYPSLKALVSIVVERVWASALDRPSSWQLRAALYAPE